MTGRRRTSPRYRAAGRSAAAATRSGEPGVSGAPDDAVGVTLPRDAVGAGSPAQAATRTQPRIAGATRLMPGAIGAKTPNDGRLVHCRVHFVDPRHRRRVASSGVLTTLQSNSEAHAKREQGARPAIHRGFVRQQPGCLLARGRHDKASSGISHHRHRHRHLWPASRVRRRASRLRPPRQRPTAPTSRLSSTSRRPSSTTPATGRASRVHSSGWPTASTHFLAISSPAIPRSRSSSSRRRRGTSRAAPTCSC